MQVCWNTSSYTVRRAAGGQRVSVRSSLDQTGFVVIKQDVAQRERISAHEGVPVWNESPGGCRAQRRKEETQREHFSR